MSDGAGTGDGAKAAAPRPAPRARPKRPDAATVAAADNSGADTNRPTSLSPDSAATSPAAPGAEEAEINEATAALPLGTRVEVEGYTCPGTVRFVGMVGDKCRVGLELDQPFGKNDGEALGERFFQCPVKRGTFVFPKKVKKLDEPLAIVPGQRVKVDGLESLGVVRYVGTIGGIKRAGIELDLKVGKNNGTVRGTIYFECGQGHGHFSYLEKVHPL
eukprot:m.174192 g.174192  ORF g.174192 m.174192 type:complete len:217 (+) comp13797_c0_seq1:80-730(+)